MRVKEGIKGKGKPSERANVPGQIILENIMPASQPRKFMLRPSSI